MINSSLTSYKLAKLLKQSTPGQLILAQLRDQEIDVDDVFEERWSERMNV